MHNTVLKSITALLISLMFIAGSIPASAAADVTESLPAQTEPAPIMTEPVATDLIVTEPASEAASAPGETASDDAADEKPDPDVSDSAPDPSLSGDVFTSASDDTDAAGTLPLGEELIKPVFAVRWDTLPMYAGSAGVFQWSIAFENGGYYIYAVTDMSESMMFTVSYDEYGDELLCCEAGVQPVILDSMRNPIPGAFVQSYVENSARYSEIYIPQSFFKDALFTIACGQAVYSLNITDSFGMPAVSGAWGEMAVPEESTSVEALDDTVFIAEDEGAMSGPAAAYAGIAIDGSYLDWDYYPHSVIQYPSGGAYEQAGDASGAIYNNGNGYVYGHTVTFAPAHQNQELGGMRQFCMSVNGTDHADLTAALMCADYDGRLHFAAAADYAASFYDIGNAHKYYIVDAAYTGLMENITPDELRAAGQLYGEAYVTKFPSRWDMEYMVDIEMLAEKAGLSGASDVKTISAQFNMLGNQWITTAGTSTGAELGIFLCLAVVCGTYLFKKKSYGDGIND